MAVSPLFKRLGHTHETCVPPVASACVLRKARRIQWHHRSVRLGQRLVDVLFEGAFQGGEHHRLHFWQMAAPDTCKYQSHCARPAWSRCARPEEPLPGSHHDSIVLSFARYTVRSKKPQSGLSVPFQHICSCLPRYRQNKKNETSHDRAMACRSSFEVLTCISLTSQTVRAPSLPPMTALRNAKKRDRWRVGASF